MRTRSTLICSFSALFCASSSSISSFRLSLSCESSVSGGVPDLNQPRVMRSMPKARVKPTQTGEQLRNLAYQEFARPILGNSVNGSFLPHKIDQGRHANMPRTFAGHAVVFGNSQFG